LIGNFCIAVLFEKFQVVRFNLRAALEWTVARDMKW
jgi:hypothetical protein